MNHKRRQVLKGAGAAGAVGVAMAAGLLKPTAVYAAPWNQAGFEARNLADALKSIMARPCLMRSGAAASAATTYLAFKVKGSKKGDKVVVSWEDNQGAKETAEATIG